MANEQNLIPSTKGGHQLTEEEAKKGGINSGKAKRERKKFTDAVKWLANSDIRITKGSVYDYFKERNIDISQYDPTQLATIGLWLGSIYGNSTNFKTLIETNKELSELEDVPFEIDKVEDIVDNSHLEKVLYEENRHNEDDKRK